MRVLAKRRVSRLLLTLFFLVVCLSSGHLFSVSFSKASALFQSNSELNSQPDRAPVMYRVSVKDSKAVQQLIHLGMDVLEVRGHGYVLVLGDEHTKNQLAESGFQTEVDPELTQRSGFSPQTFFKGYRTVEEQYAHLDALAAAHPDLVAVVDYGDSWRKLNGRPGGHDLKAVCITKLGPGDPVLSPTAPKPRFFLMAAIHARELSTSELAWRWMDYLVESYGVDPDVTMLLDYNELWVVPVVNPDGRSIVEEGVDFPFSQRKNANDSLGNCDIPPSGGNQSGVDLNRNASFQYGGAGTSSNPCSLVYRGSAPASEPEEYFLEAFLQQLFADRRGPQLTDASPSDTSGVFITLHSFSDLVLLPWGWNECNGQPCPGRFRAPNDEGLRTLAFRLSSFNEYTTGQGSEILYAASGSTDDWTYGELGIASFTFEVGPESGPCAGFAPDYSCQDTVFWPKNRGALVYAAKAARNPYECALGPTTTSLQATPATVKAGQSVTITATVDDKQFGTFGVRRPKAQKIQAAEYYIDTPPWKGGMPRQLQAADGKFNRSTESVSVEFSASLSPGKHTIYVRGQDRDGNWGPLSAVFVTVE
ncbi:MAG: carboxypeptidase [Acidobacteria bacterium]|nr:carboxypeptidase [Acidobacteriota bacterium]